MDKRDKTLKDLSIILEIPEKELIKLSSKTERNYYLPRFKKKSSGKFRRIDVPKDDLKKIQTLIRKRILSKIKLHECIHSYRKKRSPLTTAMEHINKEFLAKIDIKDFFPSIRYNRVQEIFKKAGFTKKAAEILRKLTVCDYVVPQGAPTSNSLANITISEIISERYENLVRDHDLSITVYGDDIHISGGKRVKTLYNLFQKIIRQSNFRVNEDKKDLNSRRQRQEVTGIVVNKKPNISKERRRKLEKILYQCRKFGVSNVTDKEPAKFKESILGTINYYSSVNPALKTKYMNEFNQIQW